MGGLSIAKAGSASPAAQTRRGSGPAQRYLHGGVVIRVQGALGHGGEGLADEQLREWGLRVPHHRGQDVDGCLQGRSQAASGAGREGLGRLPTLRRRHAEG